MPEPDRIQKLVETLTKCLAELDCVEAYIAAAHVDSALNALQRQFRLAGEASNTV